MIFLRRLPVRPALAGLCLFLAIVACAPEKLRSAEPKPEVPVELRVMSFNIEWGGTRISFAKVVEAIRVSGADVAGIQEAEGNLQRLADELGWYFDRQSYVISRFPVIAAPGSDGRYVFVEVSPGRAVVLASIHLTSRDYGPDAVRDGAAPEAVLAMESARRLPAVLRAIEPLRPFVQDGTPVFITGDFNTPSHADWTPATVRTRKYLFYALTWPVSMALEQAGFSDSWRVVHPDPVRNPGLTWWAARPPLEDYAPGENDAQDRIDFIWFAGAVQALSSELAGESGGPEVTWGLTPWPSDHRAVVSGFLVEPAELPELVTTGSRVYRDDTVIDIHSNSIGEAVLCVTGADNFEVLAEQRVPGGRADWLLPAAVPGPGHYRVRKCDAPPDSGPAREFWVLAGSAVPEVEITGSSFRAGDPITVRWRNAPGSRNDYLAAYMRGVTTDYENGLAWVYTRALPEGEARLDATTSLWGWPLAPGEYVIRLVKDDGYEVLAESAPFTVTAGDP